jgi:hypothetical protein
MGNNSFSRKCNNTFKELHDVNVKIGDLVINQHKIDPNVNTTEFINMNTTLDELGIKRDLLNKRIEKVCK